MGDARFSALYSAPEFALDPTDPRFKAGESSTAIIREAARQKGAQKSQAPGKVLEQEEKINPNTKEPNGEVLKFLSV